jgi:hypothetical protein
MLFLQRRWLLPCALVAVALPARAAEVDKFLPNDTEAVITLNVRQVLDSPLVKKYGEEEIKKALNKDEKAKKILAALGLDPLKDINSVTIAVATLAPGQGLNKGLLIVHGKFDTDKFRAKAEEVVKEQGDALKVHKVGGYTIYETKPAKEKGTPGGLDAMFVGLVSSNTLVAGGTQDAVVEALDKDAGKKKSGVNKELQGLLEKADAKQSLWAVTPASALRKSPLGKQDDAKAFLAKCESISLGVTVADDVKAQLLFAATNATAAKDLTAKLNDGLEQAKQIVGFLVTNNKDVAPVVDFLDTVKVAAQGNAVTVKGEFDKDAIEKSIKKEK